MDAEGYPQLLSQGVGPQSKKPCAGFNAADLAAVATCEEDLAQAAMGQLSASSRAAANNQPEEPAAPDADAITAPQAKAKAVAKAKLPAIPKGKAKAKANPVTQAALVSTVFGRLYITRGALKSYIQ